MSIIKTDNTIRIGLIGTGRIAPRFLSELKEVDGIEAVSVFNPRMSSASAFGEQYYLDSFSDWENFIDTVDAVYIATPHETHFQYAKNALLAGKHVLCEKPLGLSVDEVEKLYAIADEKQLVLLQGVKTAYFPGFNKLCEVAQSGVIGEIRDVEACFTRLTDPTKREMADQNFGGSFLEFGSYTLLPILKLLGTDYSEISFKSILAENGVDLYSKAELIYENNGVMKATAMSKTGLGVKSEGQLIIAGTEGYILVPAPWWLTKHFEVHFEDPNHVDEYDGDLPGDGLRFEMIEFVREILKYMNGESVEEQNSYLTRSECIAMADIHEQFLGIRKGKKDGV